MRPALHNSLKYLTNTGEMFLLNWVGRWDFSLLLGLPSIAIAAASAKPSTLASCVSNVVDNRLLK